jgi:cyanophycinase-like exopeptidase
VPYAINNKKQRKRHRADAKAFAHQADQVALTGGDQERVQRLRKIAAMEARLGTSKSTKRKGGVIGKQGKIAKAKVQGAASRRIGSHGKSS